MRGMNDACLTVAENPVDWIKKPKSDVFASLSPEKFPPELYLNVCSYVFWKYWKYCYRILCVLISHAMWHCLENWVVPRWTQSHVWWLWPVRFTQRAKLGEKNIVELSRSYSEVREYSNCLWNCLLNRSIVQIFSRVVSHLEAFIIVQINSGRICNFIVWLIWIGRFTK